MSLVVSGAPASARFSRHHRLLQPSAFEAGFKSCWKFFEPPLVLRAHRRKVQLPQGDGPRLGMAISKKALPRAVDRNRVKRQCRHHFRLYRQAHWAGWDFIVSLSFQGSTPIRTWVERGPLPFNRLWQAWEQRLKGRQSPTLPKPAKPVAP